MATTKKAFGVLAAASCLLIFSCGNFSEYGIPETVSVKTSARYEAALGQKYYDLSEKFGDDFIKDLSKDAGADVYKYVPDESDNQLQYILHKKVYDVPLNAGDYIDSMKLDASLSVSFSKEIVLPTIEKSLNLTVPTYPGLSIIPVPSLTAPFSFDKSLVKKARIKKGSVVISATGSGATFKVSAFGLSGVSKNEAGTATYGPADFGPGEGSGDFLINQKLDLAGAYINMNSSYVGVNGQLAKISGGSLSGSTTVVCSVSVEALEEIVVDLKQFSVEMNETSANKTRLPSEMLAYVQSVDFGHASGDYYYKSDKDGNETTTKGQGKGIQFKVVNSFPEGNDIKIVINSPTFGIDSSDGLYVNGEKKLSQADVKIPSKGSDAQFDQSFAEFTTLDFSNTAIYGDKDNPKYINFSVGFSDNQVFRNLEMGKSYKIGISDSKILFDWDRIQIKLDNVEPVSDLVDMSDFSIDSLMDEIDGEIRTLVDNCELNRLPVYFFAQKPTGDLADVIGNISLSGKIYFDYLDSSSAEQKDYIAGSESENKDISLCSQFKWPDSGEVCAKVFAEEGKDYSFKSDIAKTVNARPKNLKVGYSMGLAGGSACTFYKARFDALTKDDSATIAVDMAAVLPIELKVAKETSLDVYKIADLDMDGKKDLMDRKDFSDTEEYARYAPAITYLRISYNFINEAVDGLKATILLDDTHEGEKDADQYTGIKRTIEITGNDQSDDFIDFSGEEIQMVMTHFFKPKMTVVVPAGTIRVWRSAIESDTSIGISPVVALQLNDSVSIEITDIIKK